MSAFLMKTVLVAAAATLAQIKDNENRDCLCCQHCGVLTSGLLVHVTEDLSLSSALSRKHSGPRGHTAHLGVLEDVHDEDGETQAEDVGGEAGVEVGVCVLLQAAGKSEGRG